MSFPMNPTTYRTPLLIFAGLGIGGWMFWRFSAKKLRTFVNNQMNNTDAEDLFPERTPDTIDTFEEMVPQLTSLQRSDTPQEKWCVLYHSYVIHARNACTPNHWQTTYWLQFVALIEHEPRRAIVQHAHTKRYHLMMQVPVEQPIPCEDCFISQEVFRLPIQDHYGYFVFVPQDLNGFVLFSQAKEAAHTLPIPPDVHRLLLLAQKKELVCGEEAQNRSMSNRHVSMYTEKETDI